MRGKWILPFVLLVSAAAFSVLANDPPDSELNPVTGYPESVDIATGSGNKVRHTEDRGHLGRIVSLVSSGAGENPRIAIKPTGNSWVVWWTDAATDTISCTVRDVDDSTWTTAAVISDTSEDSRNPEIAHSGTGTFVAYEIPSGSSTLVAVAAITDDVEPYGTRTIVATTSYGSVDVMIHAESGHLWVTWVDSSSNVGWSEYDATEEAWDTTQLESYVGIGTAAAKVIIRATVLGL